MEGIQTARARVADPVMQRALAHCTPDSNPHSADPAALAAALPRVAAVPRPVPAPAPGLGTDEEIRALIERATFGFTVESYQEALSMGYDAWVEWQLDWQHIVDTQSDLRLNTFQALRLTNPELLENYPDPFVLNTELPGARIVRALFSKRQLYERVVEFWTDHFNIDQSDELCQWFKISDDRDVIRRYALGRFPDLLRRTAHSPAMMWYLDNYANVAGSVQENYGRELMELHTLGADGPYAEFDVTEVARCFTGWGVRGVDSTTGRPGTFYFDPTQHDYGEKVVLGVTIPAGGGKSDGDFVLDLLAMHPKTAHYVSSKLANWLLSYDPPGGVIDDLVQIYMSTAGDIKAMVRFLVSRSTVARVPQHRRAKLKRPLRLVTGLARALSTDSVVPNNLAFELDALGQQPFLHPTPDGYADDLSWANSTLARWTYAVRMMALDVVGNEPSITTIHALLATAPPGSSLVESIDWMLTGGGLGPQVRSRIQRFLDTHNMTDVVLREAIALGASSTSYQFH